jgi:nicotinate-nucleotide--dimethylbenzimidazole phosphoribosyltransferase
MAYTSEIEKLERRWNENPLGLTFAPLAEAYRKAGDHTRALELLEIGLAQHPNYVPAHIVRGRCNLDANGDDAAELAFLRVIELDPENAIALRSLADICERTGRVSEAVRRLETLIEVDRSNEDARLQLQRLRNAPAGSPPQAAAAPAAQQPIQPPEPAGVTEPIGAEDPAADASTAPESDDEPSDIAVYDPDDLAPTSGGEFQLPSDSEALSASGDRLTDVVLGSEIPEQALPAEQDAEGEGMLGAPSPTVAGASALPGAELAQEPVVPEIGVASRELLEPDPLPDQAASATAWAGSVFEPTSPELLAETPSLLESDDYLAEVREFEQPVESALDQESGLDTAPAFDQPPALSQTPTEDAPAAESVDAPADEAPAEEAVEAAFESVLPAEPSPEPEMAPAPEPEPVSVPVAEAAEPSDAAAWWATAQPDEPVAASQESPVPVEPEAEPPGSGPEPALVVTESMAEVFLRQGHPALALAVYTQLAQRDPENRRVAEAMARLQEELVPPAPAPAPAPRYDAASTGGMSVAARLGGLFGAARPAVAATVHPPAFEAPKRAVEPTGPGEDSLSLSSVFGEDAGSAPVGPASGPAESAEGEPSFDEFFAPQEAGELPSTPAPAQEAAGAPVQSGEDLERFNTWLRGLKG